jgi:uncharacterized membrane protein
VLNGCNYSIQKTKTTKIPPASEYSTSELTFKNIYTNIFQKKCVACHGTSGNVNLESYAAVKSQIAKVFDSTLVKMTMPKAPTSPLTVEELGQLNAWIQLGAPEGEISEPPASNLEPTFESIKLHILEPKCLGCHAPGKPTERIPLVTRENLLNSPLDIVIPGNAEESGLILSVTNQRINKVMPPPVDKLGQPTGFGPLTDIEIAILKEWINQGAN